MNLRKSKSPVNFKSLPNWTCLRDATESTSRSLPAFSPTSTRSQRAGPSKHPWRIWRKEGEGPLRAESRDSQERAQRGHRQ